MMALLLAGLWPFVIQIHVVQIGLPLIHHVPNACAHLVPYLASQSWTPSEPNGVPHCNIPWELLELLIGHDPVWWPVLDVHFLCPLPECGLCIGAVSMGCRAWWRWQHQV